LRVIALAGRRVDPPNSDARGFPLENLNLVKKGISELFRAVGVEAVVSSAACGADLLALAEAAALGLRRRVVIPFARERFRATSVVDRPGDWGPLYDSILDEVSSRNDLVVMQGEPGAPAAYAAANLAILDEASLLARSTGEPPCAALVWDGHSRGDDDLTRTFGDAARARGWQVFEVQTLRTCFVVQGFGEKTDLATGRVLNLDASYEVIKEAVEEAGLRCIRADEIIHSGTIDLPMYDWIYRADVVIADLSTYNVNAAYELGIRYGLRPQTTIIVAEDQFKNPFDVSHIVIRRYEHLGKDVGLKEARRFKQELASHIKKLLDDARVDSPVYTYLALDPPVERSSSSGGQEARADVTAARSSAAEMDQSAKDLLAQARSAMAQENFLAAKALFEAVRRLRPRDEYVVQQLALATCKIKTPDALSALEEARGYLQPLRPETTNDPETLGLWGSVHKRFWDVRHERGDLDTAIAAYERGFYLKQDYYTGINLAFLLNVRAALPRQAGDRPEAVADFVLARRIRRDVLRFCEAALAAAPDSAEARYWIVATMWEAAVGLEDPASAETFHQQARSLPVAKWMLETTQSQLARLEQLLLESPLKN
jgi:tetratricopeptide repeat protein